MIKRVLFAATLLLFASGAFTAELEETDVAGVWESASGGYVQLYKNGDAWAGRIVGSKSGEARYDKENPDESKRGRRLLGTDILSGLTYAGDGEYEGGEIYDPNSGKTYKAKAALKDADTLDVRGYIGISLLGKSQTWIRVDPNAENVDQEKLHKPVKPGAQSQ